MRINLLALLFVALSLQAQETIVVSNFETTPISLQQLNNSQYFIDNPEQNHKIVDLVNAFTIDSVFTRKFERHRVIGGGMIHLFGYKWRAYDFKRQKFVGKVNREYLRSKDEEHHFTEYDVNFDLIPYLPKYKAYVYSMYQKQLNYKGNKRKKDTANAPYIFPTEETGMNAYRLHCENTPPEALRSLLSTFSYPIHRNNSLEHHYNFKENNPVLGMYGIMALDCNHSCHPEMHPYEWLWWLNLTENTPSWNINLVRDVSNRFKHWSSSPRVGMIQVPFAFDLAADTFVLSITHQVFSNFDSEAFQLLNFDEKVYPFDKEVTDFAIEIENKDTKTFQVKSNVKIPYTSIVYALSDINVDKENGLLSGYFNLALSVEDAYAAQVKMLTK